MSTYLVAQNAPTWFQTLNANFHHYPDTTNNALFQDNISTWSKQNPNQFLWSGSDFKIGAYHLSVACSYPLCNDQQWILDENFTHRLGKKKKEITYVLRSNIC